MGRCADTSYYRQPGSPKCHAVKVYVRFDFSSVSFDPQHIYLNIMSLPNRKDYIDAIKNARVCVRDPVLKGGHPEYGDDGDLVFSFGSFAGVFLITCAGKRYALRCWISQIDDPAHRYQLVKQYLEKVRLPYFLDFEYVEHGIFADIGTQPILRMDWIEDKSLRDFIEDHLEQPHVLRAAAQNFLVMAQALHSSQIAHGDLQSENLRVRINGGGPEFTLIGYDTLFVPGLVATKVSTTGLPGFQHPRRSQIATAKDDYFAELVIYLTFHALAQRPQLWHEEDMEKREKELFRSFLWLVAELANVWESQVELAGSMVSDGSEVDEVFESPGHSLC